MSLKHKRISHPLMRIILWFLGFFLITLFLSSLLLPLLQAMNTPQPARPIEGLSALIALIFLIRFVEQRSPKETVLIRGMYGIGQQLVLGLALGAAILSAAIGAMALFGYYQISTVEPVWGALALPLWQYFWVAVVEEVATRGVLFRILEEWWGSWPALLFSALVFGALHLPNQHSSLWAALAIAVEAGILLGAAFMLSRNIWLPIGIHWAWNFFEGPVFEAPVSGGSHELVLIRPVILGPAWATGGTFGPEASLFTVLIATAVGAALLIFAGRKGRVVSPSWKRNERSPHPTP